jgi:FeS assembly SUF system regulator
MLKISKLTDYACMLLRDLAYCYPQTLSATELSNNLPVQLPTARKVLKLLAKSDLVNSSQGKDGGYLLSRPASEISLADLVTAMEGDLAITDCDSGCACRDQCRLQPHWQRVNGLISDVLSKVSFADFIVPAPHVVQEKEVVFDGQ